MTTPLLGSAPGAPAARPRRSLAKRWLRRLAVRAGVYPHISSSRMPFKIYEFAELLRGSPVRPTDRILDLGCGIGSQTLIVGRRCRQVVGVDILPDAIETARAQARAFEGIVDAEFHCGPVESLGLESASFDKVFSFCVIEHIPNCDEVLAELARLLVPGGELVLSADSLDGIDDPELLGKHRRENRVERYFRPEDLRERLERAGFTVEALYPIFRSDHARERFEDGIRRGFAYGWLEALREHALLRWHERRCRQRERGLFLIARCRVPAPGAVA